MNVLTALHQAVTILTARGIETARMDAEVLLSHCLRVNRSSLYAFPERMLNEQEIHEFISMIRRRERGEPVAYITGQKEFWSLCFLVNPHVLIPRPETEILVEEVLKICRSSYELPRILEIGTGCGAISIALAHELKRVLIVATDVSNDALQVARENARRHGVEQAIFFRHGNLFQPVSETFDVVVSNPPYISSEEFYHLPADVRDFEPREALVGGHDGFFFHREISMQAPAYLVKGGWLLMEIGFGQRAGVEEILRASGRYSKIFFREDYAGVPRVSIAKKE